MLREALLAAPPVSFTTAFIASRFARFGHEASAPFQGVEGSVVS